MGNLRQGIGLIHKLAELRGAKEFPDRRRRWLGIDKVIGHDRTDFGRVHPFANRALHPQKANAIGILPSTPQPNEPVDCRGDQYHRPPRGRP